MKKYLFTSESVSVGHPDKICDQISDSILDAFLKKDANSRIACETMVTSGQVIIVGEISSSSYVNVEGIARGVIRDIGYTMEGQGFHYEDSGILVYIHPQSEDIALGVDHNQYQSLGAGDQGIMFGYACNETETYMPATIQYAHDLVRVLQEYKKKGENWIYPDAKSQVTIEYVDDRPNEIKDIVLSVHHTRGKSQSEIKDFVKNQLIPKVLPEEMLSKDVRYFINSTGKFEVGGPKGDSGLTGRKIIVDTYGGWGAHGGGAFSGKDPSKVDRSASYMARYIAKNVVASKLANRCLVQLSYAIGVVQPISIFVDTYGTSKEVADIEIVKAIQENIDCSPQGIIDRFDLWRPIYRQTATYGHFGRNDLDLPWEKLDVVNIFKNI